MWLEKKQLGNVRKEVILIMNTQIVLNSLKEELKEIKAYAQMSKEDNIQSEEYELIIKELENKIKNITNKLKSKGRLIQKEQVCSNNKKTTELHIKHIKSNKRYKIARKQRTKLGIYTRKRKQFLKQISNKRVRTARGLSSKSNLYKKVFDLEYELD
ncbi:hypothetical protein G8V07_12485 [Clostridium botulinum D/C]|nr:hypothetical protein [Clostridium botulinum D/C]MCD3324567.1 hypothetical protein [Clostridium botulinum D/C]MCD3326867.1 hypothetical protein [Clostridium botulinum D/C]